MKTRQTVVCGFLAVLLALIFTTCKEPADTTTAKTLTGITLNTASVKKTYVQNEALNLAGLVVTAFYSDGSGATVTNYTASPANGTALSAVETKTVTISFTEGGVTRTADFSVIITAASTNPGSTPGSTKEDAIPLTANQWADGNLPIYNSEQWFSFTAASSTQHIHIDFGTLTSLFVQVYDSGDTEVGSQTYLSRSTPSTSRSLTAGQTYYIRVRYSSGTYRITFNTTFYPPGTIPQLTVNQWTDGNLPTINDQQWFSFTAASSTQYIHAAFITLSSVNNGIYVQVYDSSGYTVGSETNLGSSTPVASRTLTVGQTYYIRVRLYNSSSSGTYRIAFNTTFYPPGTIPPLTESQWADFNLPTTNDQQWFTFAATATTQYIHAAGDILTLQVYNSSGEAVGRETDLYLDSISRSLTAGQTYYIWVRRGFIGSGTYRIAFNASFVTPGGNPIGLTENQWANGDLPTSSDVQWFAFTATSSTQYIHASFGTLNSSNGVYVQVYNNNGAAVGSESRLNSSTTSTSRSLTSGRTYYIRVRYGSGGTYRIGFTTSSAAPN